MTGPGHHDTPDEDADTSTTAGDTPLETVRAPGLSHPQPMPSKKIPVTAIVATVIVALCIAGFFVVRIFDLFD